MMADYRPKIKTCTKTVPMIYAYTTPEIKRHDGWTKIGYTEQDVDTRINQQTHTADIEWHKEWQGTAIYDDGTGDTFRDTDFHAYLTRNKIRREVGKDNEWFEISGIESKSMFRDFKENRGLVTDSEKSVIAYTLRDEQAEAVEKALDYFKLHEQGAFLWNAKPRFGKTLASYDLAKRMDARMVLIVTNRPAIANSWYSDYATFLGAESGYTFVSNVDGIKDRPLVVSRDAYVAGNKGKDEWSRCIEFVSLQDLKGSRYFGGNYDKLKEIHDLEWDLLIIDEAHEGADTYKADVAFDHIRRGATLHLSGTPFKMLANDVFPENAIYNWTYADEQKKKRAYIAETGSDNPYAKLPQLNMFTYQMSEIVKDELSQGIELSGETVEYAFDLNEFFATNESGRFIHNESVNKFLDAMLTQEKFPFSTEELRNELKHTVWLLNRVDSAKALAKKLRNHPVFKDYEIILAAGNGRIDDNADSESIDEDIDNGAEEYDEKDFAKAYDRVVKAIREHDKTITLTVGQLTTGITIPEWTAVMMLSNVKSPAQYMQTAFRAQNPCLFNNGKEQYRKKNAYVFDFDPARTLIIFEKFANDLCGDTANGKGDSDTRKAHIKELLNFFPVIGEDEHGEMIELDAEKVLSIPRKIKSKEVVKRGFMSNFLFQNISNIFGAPQEVIDIIKNIAPAKEPELTTATGEELSINAEGEVELSKEQIIGINQGIFGEKKYEDITESIGNIIDDIENQNKYTDSVKQDNYYDELSKQLETNFDENVTQEIISKTSDNYGDDLRKSTRNNLEKHFNQEARTKINRAVGNLKIKRNTLEADKERELDLSKSPEETAAIEKKYAEKHKQALEDFKQALSNTVDELREKAKETAVRTVETDKKNEKKNKIEEDTRDHLRGFARTIPSFLMAYGGGCSGGDGGREGEVNTRSNSTAYDGSGRDDGNSSCDGSDGNDGMQVTLANFDKIVPGEVFEEVTSITLTQFRQLRDGFDYPDPETGELKHFNGHLFDPVVFDDSVKEFLSLKMRLADYFDESSKEDIFDYIPPQRTNQIFTPKRIVIDMVDRLEAENPGCFDDPDKTFADLYMKSGMYITEIVKRLYQSPRLKALYPDDKLRLNHIFSEQIYGCAPTEIIYRIALAYILGFSDEIEIKKHNIKLCDTLTYAKEGTLEEKLAELYPELAVNYR